MESTEPVPVEDSQASDTAVEELVTKFEEAATVTLSSQNEDDQSGEQVYGYLYRSAGSEDATIYVDSRGFNLNGQSLIVTQNDDGNEIIVLVGEDDVQPLEQTFAHSFPNSDQVNFEGDLKEHGTLVMDEHSEGLGFIKTTEEAVEESEERHVYIENNSELLNISNENIDPPVDIESSPLWTVSNSGHLKNDGTEMLFIPNPTVVLAPEETKHRKLMQLACIAHELQSADQKGSSTVICDYVKDPVSENDSQCDGQRNSVNEEADDACLSPNKPEECVKFNSKSSKIVLRGTPMRVVDNTVSVIHSTASELHSNFLENQTKPDFMSEKNFPNSENELPSEMFYSNTSQVILHDSLNGSPKELEDCSRDELENNSRSSTIAVERFSVKNDTLELHNNDSPFTFVEKSHNDDLNNIENNALSDADHDMKMDGRANSSALAIEDQNQKSHDSDSSLSLLECPLSKEIDERSSLEDTVPNQNGSEMNASDIDDDNISSTEHSVSVSENESSFSSSRYGLFNYKPKDVSLSLEKDSILSSPVLQDDKSKAVSDTTDSNESKLNIVESEIHENVKSDESGDSDQSPSENLESDLVIAEAAEDREREDVAEEVRYTEDDDMCRSRDLNSRPAAVVNEAQEFVSPDTTCASPDLPTFTPYTPSEDPKVSNDVENAATADSPAQSPSSDDPPLSHQLPSNPQELLISNDNNNNEELSNSAKSDDGGSYPSEPQYKVKGVKRTYIMNSKKKRSSTHENKSKEKIELFSGEDLHFNDGENACLSSPKGSSSSNENNTEPDDLVLDVQSKVSAQRTYTVQKENRKKKSTPFKQGLRSHSLRSRSLSSLLLKNGNGEVSDADAKKNSFDSSNADNIPWGKVLLETSFEPCSSSPNDGPSTSFTSTKETSTPLLSPEQRRRKLNKYKRDFDRLLNSSSPIATKQPKMGKKNSSRNHPNVIKASKSKYSKTHFSNLSKSLPLNANLSSPRRKLQTTRQKCTSLGEKQPKEAKIHYLASDSVRPPRSSIEEMYSCSSCNFSSIYVDNLMEHMKYCSNRQPVLHYEVNNMDKRQRIRGEEDEINNTVNNALKKIRSDLKSIYMDEDPSVSFIGDDERDSDSIKKRKSLYRQYGYGDDDVVWVKFKDRFWPALVCSIEGLTAYVKLISYPQEVKGLKVKHENIRTFDNSKWNVLCLTEAESLPHHEIFVKAVQSCERFMSKKFLGVHVTGKEFFSVRDEVDFATDSASSEASAVNEDSDSEIEIIISEPARKARYEKLDVQRIYDHIIGGKSDDYVLDIYFMRRHSKKHVTFFEKDSANLKHRTWFGPIEDIKRQEEMFCHFRELFLSKIGKKGFVVSYVCQVWIPEAIVQAISVVKGIPIKDAEILFESEGDSLDLENEDPSVEEILKKYS